jgi:hypothetical protein
MCSQAIQFCKRPNNSPLLAQLRTLVGQIAVFAFGIVLSVYVKRRWTVAVAESNSLAA